MQAEVIRIIEGGLSGDKTKVLNYATRLADNLEREGEAAFVRKIRSAIRGKSNGVATLDGFETRPVDQESRLEIVDVERVALEETQLILSEYIQSELDDFICGYEKNDTFASVGMDSPCNMLLYGPPGCGKTSIARLIAAKTQLPLVTARLDGLVSSLLGSTAKNIRKVFDYAARQECVLFLDEFDAIAKARDDANELGELKRVVNSLLQNSDNFGRSGILIAATNHHQLLDPAVWRRFTKTLEVPMPGSAELTEYAERFIVPIMGERLKPQTLTALKDLSYSNLEVVVRNAYRSAVLEGSTKLTCYHLARSAYMARHQGAGDEEELAEFLLRHGCTIRVVASKTGTSQRKVQAASKRIKNERIDNA